MTLAAIAILGLVAGLTLGGFAVALARRHPPDDGRLLTERVSYESPKGRINGYLVRAKAMGKRPAEPVPPKPTSSQPAGAIE